MTAVDRHLRGAELLDGHDLPDVALTVRLFANAVTRGARPKNWRNQRRAILRRIKFVGYPLVYPTTASRLIAAQWAGFTATETPAVPGSLRELYQRLVDLGVPPLSWQGIYAEIKD
jgi:hypothetical protein